MVALRSLPIALLGLSSLALPAGSPPLPLPPASMLATDRTDPLEHLPNGWKMGKNSWVAVSPSGEIYVLQRNLALDPVLVLDANGRLVRSWGKGLFDLPHAIRLDAKGNVWTVDCGNHTIRRFTPAGVLEQTIEIPMAERAGTGGFTGPTDIAFAPDGRFFVSDGYRNARILAFSPAGKRLREWGRHGRKPGEFETPHSITADSRMLYVSDRSNGRIQKFDFEGRYLGEWNHLGKTHGITFTRQGQLWLATQRQETPNGAEGWLIRVDPADGRILGWIESPGHSVDATAGAGIFPGGPEGRVVRFRLR